jgi:hypothetical protein
LSAAPRLRAQGAPPLELVRTAIDNELKDNSQSHLFCWKQRQIRGHGGTQVERVVNTPDGSVSRVVMIDDKPLSPAEERAEETRLRKAIEPAQMRRQMKDDAEDDARTRKMLGAIPEAFDFAYAGTLTEPNGHKLTTLKFTPRAGYNPPSREIMVFTGMAGELVVDETASRLAKVDGTLFKDVTFGWGIFGRLHKGGHFLIEKTEIAPGHWDTTHQLLHFDGKVLMFKPLHIDEDETSWDYRPVPPMTVGQALDFLNRGDQPQNATLPESSRSARSAARSARDAGHSRAPAPVSPQSFRAGKP